ncbi:hypothetical protein A9513_033075 [Pseudomonas sp. AU12215]|nr:hypothetical protein A9513_033075 [Pseudomonas sp. AU12215]
MLIAVHSLGESIVEAWVWVSIANTEIQVKGEKLNVNELRAISQGVEGPRKRLGEARNIIKSISVECRAIWGERQESAIRELLELSEVCSNYLSSYMAICSTDTDMVERSIRSVVLQRIWAELDDKKLYSHPNVLSYVERYVSSYSERLKDKFLD